MHAERDASDLRQTEQPAIEDRTATVLWIGEAVIAACALERRRTRCPCRLHSSEEGLEGAVHAQDHILQDLRVALNVLRKSRFQVWQFRLLLIVRRALALAALPPRLALLEGDIVE